MSAGPTKIRASRSNAAIPTKIRPVLRRMDIVTSRISVPRRDEACLANGGRHEKGKSVKPVAHLIGQGWGSLCRAACESRLGSHRPQLIKRGQDALPANFVLLRFDGRRKVGIELQDIV